MNAQNLIAKVWDYANILRDSGVSYTDYVAQLSYLLFLKMESEIASINPNAVSMIPSEFSWGILKKLDGLELERAYSKALSELSKQGGIVGTIYQKAQNKINEPAKLKRLISLVDGETWLGLSVDVKGAIYEGLLAKNATETKAGAGQYFTPRVLCESIVRLMRPTPQMSVCDPACGTGGFLLAAYAFMKAQSKDSEVAALFARRKALWQGHNAACGEPLCDEFVFARAWRGEFKWSFAKTATPFGRRRRLAFAARR